MTSHFHDGNYHEAVIRRITFSLPEYVLVKEQARLAKDCLDRLVDGVEDSDGQLVQEAWERLSEPVGYINSILQQRANVACREVRDEQ